jgi:predicted metal-binding protein
LTNAETRYSPNKYAFCNIYGEGERSVPPHVLLTNEDRELLTKVSDLLEEVVETVNVLEDKAAMKAIKQAERDVKAKRVRDYDEFVGE